LIPAAVAGEICLVEIPGKDGEVSTVYCAVEICVADERVGDFDLARREAGGIAGVRGVGEAERIRCGTGLCAGGEDSRAIPSAAVEAGFNFGGDGKNGIGARAVVDEEVMVSEIELSISIYDEGIDGVSDSAVDGEQTG
jgi:hypothetical protein